MSEDDKKNHVPQENPEKDPSVTFSSANPPEVIGAQIGPYKLLSVLGEGGFGIVYLAEQKKPVRRQVALKIIKPGMDSRQVIARFEAEQQALALLDHANIAHVFDAGTTETGRPYFVMEYVKGAPITAYCDRAKLTIDERLNLFLQVCEGVQHAHQKGIIHRDIKPSNILVCEQGGKAVPKIIDFGVAKALSQPLTERTLFTEQGQLIGTPEYMSPEQADVGSHDIDIRSDVYSLGVVLYELLAGVLPFDSKKLRQAAFNEIQRIIQEEEPPLPSTRISSLGNQATGVAQNRRTDTKKLVSRLHHELEWIPLKAMRKERDRRYKTVSDLAEDVQNYMNGVPLLAGPESALYRLKKSIYRHRAFAAGTAMVAIVLSVGIVVSMYQRNIANRERDRATKAELSARVQKDEALHQRDIAEQERDRAREAERLAQEQKDEALRQARIAEAVNDFLNNDLLASASPYNARGREVTVRQVLDAASQTIERKFSTEPLTEASIRQTLGRLYRLLGEYASAEPHLIRAYDIRQERLTKEHPDTLNTMHWLASLYDDQGRYKEAESLLNEVLEARKRILGEEHGYTLATMNNLALVYSGEGRYREAESLNGKILEIKTRVLGEEHPDTLTTMNNLALVYDEEKRYKEAQALYEKVLEAKKRVLGEEHPDTLTTMNNLALVYHSEKYYKEAKALYAKVLEVRNRVLGEEHPDTLNTLHCLASLYDDQGRYEEAESLFNEVLEARSRVLGEEHPRTLGTLYRLASLYSDQGKHRESELLYTEALQARKRVLGEEHPDTLSGLCSLALVYDKKGQYKEAESLYGQALEVRKRVLGEEHPDTLRTINSLATVYDHQRRYEEAESLYRRVLEARNRVLGKEHPDTLSTMQWLGSSYAKAGRNIEAETMLLQTFKGRTARLGEHHAHTLLTIRWLVWLYKSWGKADEAEQWQAKLPIVRVVPEENMRIPEALQACAVNMEKIQAAIAKYEKEKGSLPGWLSDLVPVYLPAEALFCPDDPAHTSQYSPDPRLPCSYIWEFSIGRAPRGRWDPTGEALRRDWKEQQVKVFGDVVPMARCNHHGDDKVLNLSRGGQIYWSPLVWEPVFRPTYRFGDERSTEPAGPAEVGGPAGEVDEP